MVEVQPLARCLYFWSRACLESPLFLLLTTITLRRSWLNLAAGHHYHWLHSYFRFYLALEPSSSLDLPTTASFPLSNSNSIVAKTLVLATWLRSFLIVHRFSRSSWIYSFVLGLSIKHCLGMESMGRTYASRHRRLLRRIDYWCHRHESSALSWICYKTKSSSVKFGVSCFRRG